jgi:uncharacterized repeat protein (TIGR03803 family)
MQLILSKRRLVEVSVLTFLVLGLVPCAWGATKYEVLHAFGHGEDGAGVWDSVTLDGRGNVYGTTSGGGGTGCNGQGCGTVFELTPERNGKWRHRLLYAFNGKPDASGAFGGVVFDANGNLYGTTKYGGTYDYGTVFELTPSADGWMENVLRSFEGNDGFEPWAGVVIDHFGNLYGTSPGGELVYELSYTSDQWTEVILHHFTRRHDGGGPFAGLILDAAGNLYGTTEGGGAYDAGTVYELKHTTGGWKERILYSFCPTGFPCRGGADPRLGALAMDPSGNLYGTTIVGGNTSGCGGDASCGVVYKLTRDRRGRWRETVLYNFRPGGTGHGPGAGVVRDQAGNLYGTTIYGGSSQCGCGVVFKLALQTSGKWKYTVLHTFLGSDGAQPDANLILDKRGNLYGTAATGGASGAGVVFEITP